MEDEKEVLDVSSGVYLPLGQVPQTLSRRKELLLRISVLMLLSVVLGAPSYCMDSIVPLQNVILEYMKLTEVQYNAISSFYSIPNIIFVIFGGVLIDRIGHRSSSAIFMFLVTIGQGLICLAVHLKHYHILLLGRLVFGMGSESLFLSTTKYAVVWFQGPLLSPALGIQVAFARLTAFTNMMLTPYLFRIFSKSFPNVDHLMIATWIFLIGFSYSILAFGLSLVLWFIDSTFCCLHDSVLTQPGRFDMGNIKHLFKSCPTFWLITLLCFVFYSPFGSYTSISPIYYLLKNKFDMQSSASMLSIYYLTCIVASILCGLVIGRVGGEVYWMLIGSILCMVGHTAFAISFINPLFVIIHRGIGASIIACSLWPSVKYVVPTQILGISFGIITCIQNIGLTIAPLIIALLIDKLGYFAVEVYCLVCFSASNVITSVIFMVDQVYGPGVLSMNSESRDKLNYPEIIVVEDIES